MQQTNTKCALFFFCSFCYKLFFSLHFQLMKSVNDDEMEIAVRLLLRIFSLEPRIVALFDLPDVSAGELRLHPAFVRHVKVRKSIPKACFWRCFYRRQSKNILRRGFVGVRADANSRYDASEQSDNAQQIFAAAWRSTRSEYRRYIQKLILEGRGNLHLCRRFYNTRSSAKKMVVICF